MEILAWNVRGLNSDVRVKAFSSLLRKHKPVMAFVSETKIRLESDMKKLASDLGFDDSIVVPSMGRSGGLALMWSANVSVNYRSHSNNHIDVVIDPIQGTGSSWRFTGFYGHPEASERHLSWSKIRDFADNNSLPWLMAGDFNEIVHQSEKLGGIDRAGWQMRNFMHTLQYAQLHDLGYEGTIYTWSNHETQVRLDRAVASRAWSQFYGHTRVVHLPPFGSDHVPLLIGVHVSPPVASAFKKQFRFENYWVQEDGCDETVKEAWQKHVYGLPLHQLTLRIANVRQALNPWQRKTFRGRAEEMDAIRARLHHLLGLRITDATRQESKDLNEKLEKLLQREPDHWKQRAKVKWMLHGDRNTNFFHQKASKRKTSNTLDKLQDEDGILQDKAAEMEGIVLRYFSSLYSASPVQQHDVDRVVNLIPRTVTNAMCADLMAPYSFEKIKDATFYMHPSKSPGPDGMPPFFYQYYWDLVGELVCMAVKIFLETGFLEKKINLTHICLIPKVKNPNKMTDLRPIALCNVIYKICTKVLANRMKNVLHQVISPFQGAFVPGRLITDNILVANELAHHIHTHEERGEDNMALKLDMSKAYDRMEWGYLIKVLQKMGFPGLWLQVIMQCLSTVRYKFMINGAAKGLLAPTRGLRQGDPLSPYLFLIGAEGFSGLIQQKYEDGMLRGLQICVNAPTIHHLLFADDSLMFAKATLDEGIEILDVLSTYESASGQMVNYEKSSIVFSKSTPEEIQDNLAALLGMEVVEKHEKYLGLPTYVGRAKKPTFQYIKDRLQSKLIGWQERMLSSAGKDILIRIVAQSLPTYAMNCFLLPKTFCDELHMMCQKFWWGTMPEKRKIHWLEWEELCIGKEDGGLGFRNLLVHNIAMLAKQFLIVLENLQSLIARLYGARYLRNNSIWDVEEARGSSYSWTSILAARDMVRKGLSWQVCNGESVRIWEDNWIPSLAWKRPSSANFVTHITKVKELLNPWGGWNIDLVEALFDNEDAEAIKALPVSTTGVADRQIWSYTKHGEFTVKSAYLEEMKIVNAGRISRIDIPKGFWKALWGSNIPQKAKVHIWRCCREILPTRTRLLSKFVWIEHGCLLCGEPQETINHAMRDCVFAAQLREKIPHFSTAMSYVSPFGAVSLWLLQCLEELPTEVFDALLYFLWSLWRERNDRIFNEKFLSVNALFMQSWSMFQAYIAVRAKAKHIPRVCGYSESWSKPPLGWLKANVGIAFDPSVDRAGFGIVFRDHSGTCVGGVARVLDYASSWQKSRALALKEAVQFAVLKCLTPAFFEVDSKELVSSVVPGRVCSFLGPIIEDISLALRSSNGSVINFVKSIGNRHAVRLARLALSNEFSLEWVGNIPPLLENVQLHLYTS